MNKYGSLIQWCCQGKTTVIGGEFLPLSLPSPYIPQALNFNLTPISSVTAPRLAVWAMAQHYIHLGLPFNSNILRKFPSLQFPCCVCPSVPMSQPGNCWADFHEIWSWEFHKKEFENFQPLFLPLFSWKKFKSLLHVHLPACVLFASIQNVAAEYLQQQKHSKLSCG
jgi:hypothetical protein